MWKQRTTVLSQDDGSLIVAAAVRCCCCFVEKKRLPRARSAEMKKRVCIARVHLKSRLHANEFYDLRGARKVEGYKIEIRTMTN